MLAFLCFDARKYRGNQGTKAIRARAGKLSMQEAN
jgi:hypothetical protein